MLAPFIYYICSLKKIKESSCTEFGTFIWIMPLMGLALLICYIWGRYYAARLDYANTVRSFLDETDTGVDTESNEESRESNSILHMHSSSPPQGESTESAYLYSRYTNT